MLAKHPDDIARREICESKAIIEREIGAQVKHLAYPVGDPGSAARQARAARPAPRAPSRREQGWRGLDVYGVPAARDRSWAKRRAAGRFAHRVMNPSRNRCIRSVKPG
jgi:hypothetical protein